jgi:hypothetical protein
VVVHWLGIHGSKALDPSFHLPYLSPSESVGYLKYRARTGKGAQVSRHRQ